MFTRYVRAGRVNRDAPSGNVTKILLRPVLRFGDVAVVAAQYVPPVGAPVIRATRVVAVFFGKADIVVDFPDVVPVLAVDLPPVAFVELFRLFLAGVAVDFKPVEGEPEKDFVVDRFLAHLGVVVMVNVTHGGVAVPEGRVYEVAVRIEGVAVLRFHRPVRGHAVDRHGDHPLVLQLRDGILLFRLEGKLDVPIHLTRRVIVALYVFMVRDAIANDDPFPLGFAFVMRYIVRKRIAVRIFEIFG